MELDLIEKLEDVLLEMADIGLIELIDILHCFSCFLEIFLFIGNCL